MDELPDEIRLEGEIVARLRTFARAAGEALSPRLFDLYDRVQVREAPGYFLHPLALPVLDVPLWLARAGLAVSRDVVLDAAESAAAGYLHVRVQDDLLDEGVGGREAPLVSAVLAARHQRLLAGIVGGHAGFWSHFEARWTAFGDAMLLERRLADGEGTWDARTFDRVLDRSRPLVIPGAAVLAAAGDWEKLDDLERFVSALVRAHQLLADLVDVDKDLRNGNVTWVVARFGGDAATVRRRLYLEGGFDQVCEEIGADSARARKAAEDLGLPDAVAFVDKRARVAEDVERRAYGLFFAHALSGAGGT